jgi:hypothetical protein
VRHVVREPIVVGCVAVRLVWFVLIAELGGAAAVAEVTGRKVRQVRQAMAFCGAVACIAAVHVVVTVSLQLTVSLFACLCVCGCVDSEHASNRTTSQ